MGTYDRLKRQQEFKVSHRYEGLTEHSETTTWKGDVDTLPRSTIGINQLYLTLSLE